MTVLQACRRRQDPWRDGSRPLKRPLGASRRQASNSLQNVPPEAHADSPQTSAPRFCGRPHPHNIPDVDGRIQEDAAVPLGSKGLAEVKDDSVQAKARRRLDQDDVARPHRPRRRFDLDHGALAENGLHAFPRHRQLTSARIENQTLTKHGHRQFRRDCPFGKTHEGRDPGRVRSTSPTRARFEIRPRTEARGSVRPGIFFGKRARTM